MIKTIKLIKNNWMVATKLMVAGFFAYTAGQFLSSTEIAYIASPIVGLLGVKSFEFAISLVTHT